MSEYVVDFSKVAAKTTGKLEGFDRSRANLMFLVREEIVRCKDCKHFATNIHGSYCKKSISTTSDSNGYCAWGKRRSA